MIDSFDDGKRYLYIYYPGKWIIRANESSVTRIADLKDLIQENDVCFFLNGTLISDVLPLKMYSISDNDVIIVVPNRSKGTNNHKVTVFCQDTESIKEQFTQYSDPSYACENARLKDIQMYKVERKPRIFRRMCQSYRDTHEVPPASEQAVTNIPKIVSISKSPLPIFWGSEPFIDNQPLSDLDSPIVTSADLSEFNRK